MPVILGVPCESCGTELYNPLERLYDPERSVFYCSECAELEAATRAEEALREFEARRRSFPEFSGVPARPSGELVRQIPPGKPKTPGRVRRRSDARDYSALSL